MTTLEVLEVSSRKPGLGIKVAPSGYISKDGKRISLEEAARICAGHRIAPRYDWAKLNQATQDFFFSLCERMQESNRDYQLDAPAQVGRGGISIGLQDCPRLTNLKRAGLIEGFADPNQKSRRYLQLTELGRAKWAAYLGA